MQPSFKLIRPRSGTDGDAHEDAFVLRFAALLAYARHLVGNAPALADDLLQDAFVQFTSARPNLAAIDNLDGYLATLVRNLHISWMRRKANRQQLHVSIEAYDSADFALGACEPELRAIAWDGLKRVALYVCLRKDDAKVASILALRFFHGFYRAEIARLVGMPERVIDRWLWQARHEARAFLDERDLPSAAAEAPLPWPPAPPRDALEVAAALRTALYSRRQAPCLTAAHFRPASGGGRPPLDARALSHLVSCPTCLAHARVALGIRSSGDRDPSDPADRTRGGRSAEASAARAFRTAARRRRRDVLEHRPKELRVSVNGLLVGDIAIDAAHTRVRWTVRLDEPFAFAEIHSEQGVRLALLTIVPVPAGELRQMATVEMSDGRRAALGVDFAEAHPTICVEYDDPLFVPTNLDERHHSYDSAAGQREPDQARARARDPRPAPPRRWEWPPLPRPRWLVPVLSVALLAAAIWWVRRGEALTPTAAAVLEQAVGAAIANTPGRTSAVHRTLRLTVQDARTGGSSHRVETWTLGSDGPRATRVLDAAGHVAAGEWVDREGRATTLPLGAVDEVWRAGLTAAAFRDRYAIDATCLVEPASTVLTIRCDRADRTSLLGAMYPVLFAVADFGYLHPWRAELVVRHVDLHPIRLLLMARDSGVERRVTLEEEALRHLPVSDVPDEVLRPDAPVSPSAASTPLPRPIRRPAASRSLEIRAWEIVDRLASEGQVSVARSPQGRLSVTGMVDSAATKQALQRALSSIDVDGVVQWDVLTYHEAATRNTRRPDPTRVEVHDVPVGSPPIASYLRASGRVLTSAEIVALSDRVVAASRQARLRVSAMVVVIARFPEADVGGLGPDGRTAWRNLIQRHATTCVDALTKLDEALRPNLPAAAGTASPAARTIDAAARRLQMELATIDSAVVGAFMSVSSDVDESRFRSALGLRTHVAQAIADAAFVLHALQP